MPDPLLIEGGVHHFDIIRALTRSDARNVYVSSWNPPWGEYAGDSIAIAVCEMVNGTRCLYEGAKTSASTLNGWGQDYIRAECELATVVLDRRKLTVLRSGADRENLTQASVPLSRDRTTWANTLIAEDFCRWVAGGPAPATNYQDNLQCSAFLFAAVDSAHSGAVVDVQGLLTEAAERVGYGGPTRFEPDAASQCSQAPSGGPTSSRLS